MKPKKIWANLGVHDLQRTTQFYNAIGFKPNGRHSVTPELTSFTIGDQDFVIHFFLKKVLESNMNVKISNAQEEIEVMFTLSADSREEVDVWAQEVVQAGGTIRSAPEEFGTGYYGFVFSDPDGHTFNVFYM